MDKNFKMFFFFRKECKFKIEMMLSKLLFNYMFQRTCFLGFC